MKFSRFALPLQEKALIPTLSNLRKGADPREAVLPSWPGHNLPELSPPPDVSRHR